MILQSLRAHCLAPEGPGSIWNYLGAPVRSTGVSGRFACGFRTDLHFADVQCPKSSIIIAAWGGPLTIAFQVNLPTPSITA
jgi:hypothetical protein